MVIEQSHSSISKVIEVGCICNDAEITPEGLHGQPTEGALIAAAWKVSNYFLIIHIFMSPPLSGRNI